MSKRVKAHQKEEKVLAFIEANKNLQGLFNLGQGAVIVNLPLFLETQKKIILTKPSQRQYDISLYHLGQLKKNNVRRLSIHSYSTQQRHRK